MSLWQLSLGAPALAKLPDGWHKAGDRPNAYDMDLDPSTPYGAKPSARVKSKLQEIGGFGTLMQSVKADEYRGKRVRLSGFVKVEAVEERAWLWMRVDAGERRGVVFDNMYQRPIKGTQPWQSYAVVLDVAPEADLIAFGIGMAGTGTAWLNQAKLEVVYKTVPTTNVPMRKAPDNLDFSK